MDQEIILKLKQAAERYECAAFIASDPVQFPHRYTDRRDIEVSAFISAWMAYGSRKVFLGVLDRLHGMMGSPYSYIMSDEWGKFRGNSSCLYRFYTWNDFAVLCERLQSVYRCMDSLEPLFTDGTLCKEFAGVNGIPVDGSKSANKRMHMFLRWMVRIGSPVDFGLWKSISPSQLVIPLDTHVYQIATRLGLTARKQADLKTAVEITNALALIWPDDPVRGDFALYGAEVASDGTVSGIG